VGRLTRQWLANGDFDLVHVHEPVTPSVTWHAVRAARVPVVATAHTAQEQARVLRWSAATAGRRVMSRVDLWTAVSDDAAATLARYCPTEPRLVPNALDLDAFAAPQLEPSPAGPARLLFLGRLEEPRKGLAVALEAFDRITRAGADAVLDVAGPGDLDAVARRLRPRLPDAVRERVTALGPVDLPEKAELLARADVVLAPQLGGESFGIVVAEAMAAGAAVLASDLPAFRRLLHDGECGVLVPPGDAGAWTRALTDLLADPDRRTFLGKQAQEAVAHLDWERVTGALLDVYAEALSLRGGGPRVSPPGSSARRLGGAGQPPTAPTRTSGRGPVRPAHRPEPEAE
jgi:phosphatidylinositol alpha-mannosyltransferase